MDYLWSSCDSSSPNSSLIRGSSTVSSCHWVHGCNQLPAWQQSDAFDQLTQTDPQRLAGGVCDPSGLRMPARTAGVVLATRAPHWDAHAAMMTVSAAVTSRRTRWFEVEMESDAGCCDAGFTQCTLEKNFTSSPIIHFITSATFYCNISALVTFCLGFMRSGYTFIPHTESVPFLFVSSSVALCAAGWMKALAPLSSQTPANFNRSPEWKLLKHQSHNWWKWQLFVQPVGFTKQLTSAAMVKSEVLLSLYLLIMGRNVCLLCSDIIPITSCISMTISVEMICSWFLLNCPDSYSAEGEGLNWNSINVKSIHKWHFSWCLHANTVLLYVTIECSTDWASGHKMFCVSVCEFDLRRKTL